MTHTTTPVPRTQYYTATTLDGYIADANHSLDWLFQFGEEATEDYPGQPVWVFTTRKLETAPDADIRFVRGDVTPVHREMTKVAAGKNIWIVGGGDLVGQFHDRGLLDEIIMTIAPVILGAGKPLLPRRITTPPLRLLGTQLYEPFVQLRYAVDQTPRT
jgi:dihydrofolate reductase